MPGTMLDVAFQGVDVAWRQDHAHAGGVHRAGEVGNSPFAAMGDMRTQIFRCAVPP